MKDNARCYAQPLSGIVLAVYILWAINSTGGISCAQGTLPDEVLIRHVPRQPQTLNLSCESRSAADLAAFWDLPVGELRILAALPKSDNPHKGFVGDVNAFPGSLPPVGYGVYAEPVALVLRKFGLDAAAMYAPDLHWLRAELAAGRPVLVWATYDMKDHPVQIWRSTDGFASRVVQFEHTFTVIGYDGGG